MISLRLEEVVTALALPVRTGSVGILNRRLFGLPRLWYFYPTVQGFALHGDVMGQWSLSGAMLFVSQPSLLTTTTSFVFFVLP